MDPGFDLEQLMWLASGLSLLGLIGTIVGVPWVVARLPHDYFNQSRRSVWRELAEEPAFALVLAVVKNALGALLVLLGIVMLVTPGQGLLTLLVGLLLMNFPGKYQLERWLVRRPGVLGALNWLRQRGGHAPFDPPAY
jgi:Putative transmembrane protein (PGPGW)